MVYELADTEKATVLFEGWSETLIWSCLQRVMGKIYVTDLEKPQSALAFVGCFAFYAGEPDRELVMHKPAGFVIMTPQNEAWASFIEECWPSAKKETRFSIRKDTQFDIPALKKMAETIPEGYELQRIDAEIYIEIEVDTVSEERRKGLATIVSAALILLYLEEGLYPSWDAQNMLSVHLAEKLGYEFDHEYTVYEVASDERTH